jgi:predicted amidohydrolase YtcJ
MESDRFSKGWYGQERMTRKEALKAFTIWAARAAGMDHVVGSLEPSKYADFVILSDDLETIPDKDLPTVRVLSTWISGEQVFAVPQ